eukprot:SAG11_NODE_1187_length_5588_cov_6.285662_2_plen_85_part_00
MRASVDEAAVAVGCGGGHRVVGTGDVDVEGQPPVRPHHLRVRPLRRAVILDFLVGAMNHHDAQPTPRPVRKNVRDMTMRVRRSV